MTTTTVAAPRKRFAKPLRHYIGVWARYIVLIFWCATTVFPFAWTVLSAFKDNSQIYGKPLALPNPVIWSNFADAWVGTNVLTTGLNSLMYAVVTVALVVCLAAPAAFFCAKIAKSKWIHLLFTSGIMIPVHAILIPCFVTIRDLGLYNNRLGIIIIYVACNLAFSIFVLTAFMKSALPDEIIEASVIDGCGAFRAFLHVLPLCQTGLATSVTFVFLGVWNEMLFAMCLLPSPALRTLNIACISLKGQFISDQGLLSAALVLLIVPAVIIYTLFQEQVVKGLTAGAVKG